MLGGGVLDRPVLDKTGIAGLFSFQIEFARDENVANRFPPAFFRSAEPGIPPGPSLTTVLDELGLKLVPDQGPRGIVVVDSAERPSLN
jgi:uncharacterized protein (TIGR03435 family)